MNINMIPQSKVFFSFLFFSFLFFSFLFSFLFFSFFFSFYLFFVRGQDCTVEARCGKIALTPRRSPSLSREFQILSRSRATLRASVGIYSCFRTFFKELWVPSGTRSLRYSVHFLRVLDFTDVLPGQSRFLTREWWVQDRRY